jgi:branched-chain amino acid transport system permease protein
MDFLIKLVTDPLGWYDANQLVVGQMGLNALVALSIWVTLYTGQLTLANVGFMAIGAYTAVIMALHLHTPFVLNALCGTVFAAVVGLIIGLPVLRLRGVYLAIATIGFGEVVRFGFILNIDITGKGQGLTNPGAEPGTAGIVPIWIALVVLTAVLWRLRSSKAGQACAAIREDELAAASGGIRVTAYKLGAFVLGAAIAGLAGALEARLNFFIDPTEYGVQRAIFVLILAFVGGIAWPIGAVVGAVVLTVLPDVIRSARDYRYVVYGLILMAIALFRPQGLVAPRGQRKWWRGPRPRWPGRAARSPQRDQATEPA